MQKSDKKREKPPRDDQGAPAKKKRSTTGACEYCRSNHLRCEGGAICGQCSKRGIACVYPSPKKRGPKPGLRRQQRVPSASTNPSSPPTSEASSASSPSFGAISIPMTQQSLLKDWSQPKALSPPSPSSNSSSVSPPLQIALPQAVTMPLPAPATTASMQNHIFPSQPSPTPWSNEALYTNELSKYLDAFMNYIFPIIPSIDPRLLNSEFVKGFLTDKNFQLPSDLQKPNRSVISLQVHAILANGARLCHRKEESEQFMLKARDQAREVYDLTDYDVANGMHIMSYYYAGSGDQNKASHYNVLAFKICESLQILESSSVGRKALVVLASMTENKEERASIFAKLCNKTVQVTFWEEIIYTNCLLIYAELLHNPAPDLMNILKLLDEADKWTDQVASEFMKMAMTLILAGLKAGVFWAVGLKDFASSWAATATQICGRNNPLLSYCPPLAVHALEWPAFIHFTTKRWDILQNDLNSIRQLASIYPIAEQLLAKLASPFNMTIYTSLPSASHPDSNNTSNNNPNPQNGQPPITHTLYFPSNIKSEHLISPSNSGNITIKAERKPSLEHPPHFFPPSSSFSGISPRSSFSFPVDIYDLFNAPRLSDPNLASATEHLSSFSSVSSGSGSTSSPSSSSSSPSTMHSQSYPFSTLPPTSGSFSGPSGSFSGPSGSFSLSFGSGLFPSGSFSGPSGGSFSLQPPSSGSFSIPTSSPGSFSLPAGLSGLLSSTSAGALPSERLSFSDIFPGVTSLKTANETPE